MGALIRADILATNLQMCVLAVGKHELTHTTGGGGGPAGERTWVKEQYDNKDWPAVSYN